MYNSWKLKEVDEGKLWDLEVRPLDSVSCPYMELLPGVKQVIPPFWT